MSNNNPNIMYNPLSTKESSSTNDIDNEHDNYNDSQPSDCETLLSNNEDSTTYKPTSFSLKRRQKNLFYLYMALIPIISICLIGFGAWIGSRYLAPTADEICPSWGQQYSPILKEVDNSIHLVRFNGSFMKENDFRLEAGPKVDAAWDSLGVGYRSLTVPSSEAPATGLTPDQVKISPKYGGGYPANVEGLHHLHCLNLLRQSLYYNIDYYRSRGRGAFKNEENIVRYHVSHCLDIIRQRLMCQPDTGLLGQVWWDPEAPKAFVDFNTEHKCRDFDAIRRWAEERQIAETVPQDFLEPPKRGDRIFDSIP